MDNDAIVRYLADVDDWLAEIYVGLQMETDATTGIAPPPRLRNYKH